jgi:hypothetical protein
MIGQNECGWCKRMYSYPSSYSYEFIASTQDYTLLVLPVPLQIRQILRGGTIPIAFGCDIIELDRSFGLWNGFTLLLSRLSDWYRCNGSSAGPQGAVASILGLWNSCRILRQNIWPPFQRVVNDYIRGRSALRCLLTVIHGVLSAASWGDSARLKPMTVTSDK